MTLAEYYPPELRMGKKCLYNHGKQVKKYGGFRDFCQLDFYTLLEAQSRRCAMCRVSFSREIPVTLDLVKPLGRGGDFTRDNAWILCQECHHEKDARPKRRDRKNWRDYPWYQTCNARKQLQETLDLFSKKREDAHECN
ncbi:hypothetical protein LCGC14_1323870 [marine sediment metagenome]|uniref:HNH nuclease domain-containing protein n=1 Tax=marine sediment metagenome TaxID=412755 RepID=A0A0F9NL30_9ZZZZ